jgi:transcription elongation factor SPT5
MVSGSYMFSYASQSRKGRVLHLFQSFYAFLRNQDIVENGGVFVTRCRALASQIPKGKVGVDSTKMNPAMAGGAGGPPGVVNITRGPRDRYQGLEIKIVKGAHKGHIGIIKDTNAGTARVEVSSKNKIITMPLDALKGRMCVRLRTSCVSVFES